MRRVRARSRSVTATLPGSSPRASLSDARSRAAYSSSRESAPPRSIQRASSSRSSVTARCARRSSTASSPTGGESRPYAARIIERTSLRTAASGSASAAEVVEHAQRLPAQLERLLDDPLGIAHRPAAQPPLEVVDVRARQARRTASGGSRRGRGARRSRHSKRRNERSAWPNDVLPIRMRPSIAYGTSSAVSAVSSWARWRSTLGQTMRISSGLVPPRISFSASSATSSSVPRAPAPSRNRIEPSSGGAGGGSSANRWRSRCASAGGATSP